MFNPKQLLVVDDDPAVRETVALLLHAVGYEVSTARDGFDGLVKLRETLPELIIADLNMPHMSGFEFLSVVRRRFPQVLVIAMSGAYDIQGNMPESVLADAFYGKGEGSPRKLLTLIDDVLGHEPSYVSSHTSTPVWVPRLRDDDRRSSYVVLTCTQCLRSFPCTQCLGSRPPEEEDSIPPMMATECVFCESKVRYIVDWTDAATTAQTRCCPETLPEEKSRQVAYPSR